MPTKLKITTCTLDKSGTPTAGSDSFEAMINPEQYSINSSIEYSFGKGFGTGGKEWKFKAVPADTFSLGPMILDGTGVVEGSEGQTVAQRIATLRRVAYTFDGSTHQTPVVQIAWGSALIRFVRLKSMNVDYTMFTAAGEPLRARLSLGFVEYKSQKTVAATDNPRSPDLTHYVEVKSGDTLPLLCERIYKKPGYHTQVARVNRLSSVRSLVPGAVLTFPPLRG